MIKKYKIGDKVKVASDNDNDCYDSFREQVLIIDGIYGKDHPGYDMGVYPQKLIEFEGVGCALYEYEIEPA